ncbi:MAG: hypothetical protein OJF51_004769 [Nitrospira sp.]|nr:MAG: hypothetical protein OJF51_004769 [Nitrospira sp.]
MIDCRGSLHEVIHDWISNSQNLFLGHMVQAHDSYSRSA